MIARNSLQTNPTAPRRMRPSVTPRDLHFQHQATPSNAWLGGDVVGTAILNALSLTFPAGERLFMDAVRQYRAQLSGRLLEEARAFITQEAVHSREHLARNGGLDPARYPVEAIEAEIRERMTRVRERGPMAMLSVTIALEHFTAILADLLLSDDSLLDGAPPEIARLWRWHALEETEHKAVAFDVFLEATKDWTQRRATHEGRFAIRRHAGRPPSFSSPASPVSYAARLLTGRRHEPVDGQGAGAVVPVRQTRSVPGRVWRAPTPHWYPRRLPPVGPRQHPPDGRAGEREFLTPPRQDITPPERLRIPVRGLKVYIPFQSPS